MEQNHTSTNLPTAASSATWSNPTRITADDGSNATYSPGGSATGAITGSTFGFPSLPADAVIDGIGVYIDGTQNSASSTLTLNISGSSSKTANFGDMTGGPTDLWGKSSIAWSDLASLTATISTETFGAPGNASIDYIAITVYWHVAISEVQAEVPSRYAYKVYSRSGTYLGELPNVTSKFAVSQDIGTAGSSIQITCGKSVENEITTAPLLDNNSDPITDNNDFDLLVTESEIFIAEGASDDDAIFKNSNRIKIWEYNYYHPNGKLVFSGQINRVDFSYGTGDSTAKLLVFSDGLDLDNYLLTPTSSYSYTNDVSQTTQGAYSTLSLYIEGKNPISWLYLGQTFKTGSIANLGAISLMVQGEADVTVSIRSSVNSGNFLGSATKRVSNASPGIVQIEFANPIPVSPDTTYFMMVQVANYQTLRVFRSTSNVYADGKAYQSATGSTGFSARTDDLYFVTKSATSGNTTSTYTSKDPITGMVSEILADYNSRGGYIRERDFEATGLSLTYTFNTSTVFEGVRKGIELAPAGFYSFIDLGTAEMDIKQISDTADYTVVKGNDVHQLTLALSIEQVKNNLMLSGGEVSPGVNLYKQYQDLESAAFYGQRTVGKSDNRLTLTATANAMGTSFIEESSNETQETTVTVMNNRMDIWLLEPGKTLGFRNFGNFIDSLVLQIVRRDILPGGVGAVLTLGRLPIRLNDEVQRINRELQNQQTINNPVSPS